MRKILWLFVAIIFIALAGGIGYWQGADKVRNGLIANYPTVKNIVQSANVEFFDSLEIVTLNQEDGEELFDLLNNDPKSKSLELRIPYYARYGIDLSVRNFRLFRDGQVVEVWLPDSKLLYCELKFEKMLINGKSGTAVIKGDHYALLKNKMYELLIPLLEKNKPNQKAAKISVAKALMFYFMPYNFNLKLYIREEEQTLPLITGINQSVDEAIHQIIGK